MMGYDRARQRVVVFGGETNNATALGDFWEWDGTDWRQRVWTPAPLARRRGALAWCASRGELLLFGGEGAVLRLLGDTWTHGTVEPAGYDTFGAGCVGSNGVPQLQAANGSLPWLGEVFRIELQNGLPTSWSVALLGRSTSDWSGIPLPLDLGALGAPGCSLLVSGDLLTLTDIDAAGRAMTSYPIPADLTLLGARFFNQVLVLDLGANLLGLVGSNGATARIGAR
jgi:hypothetical protein